MSIEPLEKGDKTPSASQDKESSRGFDAPFKSNTVVNNPSILASISEKWKDPQTPVSKAMNEQTNLTNSPVPGNGTLDSSKAPTSRRNIILTSVPNPNPR